MPLWSRLKNSFRARRTYEDADEELRHHFEQRVQAFIKRGFSEEEAHRAACQQVGNLTALSEQSAEAELLTSLETLKRETLIALRLIRRTPTVTAIALTSLALAIGANTAIFTLMKQVVLDYLPVPEPEQLVILHNQEPEEGHSQTDGMRSSFSYPLYRDLNLGTSQIFDGVLAFKPIGVSLSRHGTAESVNGYLASGNFFDVLRVRPWRGRLLRPDDAAKPGANSVVVLSYGLWQSRFGSDSKIVGQTISINQHPFVVIGITPPSFYGISVSDRADLYVPITMKAQVFPGPAELDNRLFHWASLVARMRPGVNSTRATAALRTIYPPLRDQDLAVIKSPSANFAQRFARKQILLSQGARGYADLREQLAEPLQILTVMVGLVLLIAVINIANLVVARSLARRREMAIRLSIGAGRGSVIRQVLLENAILASLGGALGIALAYAGTPALLRIMSFNLSAGALSAQPDWVVMLFSLAVSAASGVAFGLLPAWQSARTEPALALTTQGSFGHSGTTGWLRPGLVIGQVGLSLLMLCLAALFARSLHNLENIDAGFDTHNLLRFSVSPSQAGYTVPAIKTFGEELRRRLVTIPGVQSAVISTVAVLEDDSVGGDVTVEGSGAKQNGQDNGHLRNFVSPGYFSGMHISVREGRQFTDADRSVDLKPVVVNETFVQHFLKQRDPLGVHLGFGSGNSVKMTMTIVGVAADSKHAGVRDKTGPFIYLPYLASNDLDSLVFYVRYHGDEYAIASAIRKYVGELDHSLPVNRLTSMRSIVNESLAVQRSLSFLSVGFAVLATLLAIVGLYGVMAYAVESRTRELAIRMALGASPQAVLGGTLRQAGLLVFAGILLGIAPVWFAGRLVQSALYNVEPTSIRLWFAAAALMLAVGVLASFGPAWRASHIDPNRALRAE